jgi:hypothetical protein
MKDELKGVGGGVGGSRRGVERMVFIAKSRMHWPHLGNMIGKV